MFLAVYIKKYKSMILVGIVFFYIGRGFSTSCEVDAGSKLGIESEKLEHKDAKTRSWDLTAQYVVLVVSGPDNLAKRNAIRATWKKLAYNIIVENGHIVYKWNQSKAENGQTNLIHLYFVIGGMDLDPLKYQKLEFESRSNHDVLLEDTLVDGYDNLSNKILFSLKWFSKNYKQLKYLIKSDDDSFVRVDLVVKELAAYAPEMNSRAISEYVSLRDIPVKPKGLYWGYFNGHARVYLNGKWKEKEWFLCDNYLPYALGGGYVVSRIIVDYIAQNSHFLSHYKSEDVSMGVWTAALDGIQRVHDTRFDTEWRSRGCRNSLLIRHNQTTGDMLQMYQELLKSRGEKLCNIETVKRNPYLYHWNLLPGQCCA